jgi:hypothetical protein
MLVSSSNSSVHAYIDDVLAEAEELEMMFTAIISLEAIFGILGRASPISWMSQRILMNGKLNWI